MSRADQLELMRGLLDYADLCISHGRLHAAEEALADAFRLDARMAAANYAADDVAARTLRSAA